MFIFGRSRAAAPVHTRAARAAAIELGARFSQTTGLTASTWRPVFSPGTGTVIWTARVEHLDDLDAAYQKWSADTASLDWLEENDHLWQGPSNDAVSQVIYGTPPAEPGPIVSVVQSQWTPGKASEALRRGAEVAELYSSLTGAPAMFLSAVTGQFAGVLWMTTFASIGASAEADATAAADERWMSMLDEASGCFEPGATSILLQRLA
jgi:hypothetical protein